MLLAMRHWSQADVNSNLHRCHSGSSMASNPLAENQLAAHLPLKKITLFANFGVFDQKC